MAIDDEILDITNGHNWGDYSAITPFSDAPMWTYAAQCYVSSEGFENSNRSRHTYDVFRSLMSLQQTEIHQQLGFFNLTGESAFGALAHANLKSKIACLWGTIGGRFVQYAQRITICDCSGLSILRLPTSSQTNRGVLGHLHADMLPSWKDFSATEKTTVLVVSVFRILPDVYCGEHVFEDRVLTMNGP